MDNYERLYQMIVMLAEKVVKIIEASKNVIEKAAFVPSNNSFPKDINVKECTTIYSFLVQEHRCLCTLMLIDASLYSLIPEIIN